jgi:GT2 family glycosyltransferase
MTPWLSVVVPVHEGARFLPATLEAAAAERPEGVEFLLYDSSDDAGGDAGASRAIAADFADRLAIRYVATPELKPWTAKTNRGVREASAGHVAMLHQDDLWRPGHLAAVRAALAAAPGAAMTIGPSRFIDAAGRDVGAWDLPFAPGLHGGGDVIATLIVQNSIAIPSPVISRAAWLAVGGMDEALWYTADWDLYLKLAAHGPVHVRPGATTAFRLHGSSLTMTGSRKADEFRAQHEVVLARHLSAVPGGVRARQERLARAAVAANCALAAGSRGGLGALGRGLAAVAALGPLGWARFLRQTRLVDRVMPRLRLALAGGMRGDGGP